MFSVILYSVPGTCGRSNIHGFREFQCFIGTQTCLRHVVENLQFFLQWSFDIVREFLKADKVDISDLWPHVGFSHEFHVNIFV